MEKPNITQQGGIPVFEELRKDLLDNQKEGGQKQVELLQKYEDEIIKLNPDSKRE